ncbi:hypothetical protein AALO_G00188480 [Alosa alosa]|uniref:Ribosomal protein S14 n=1 Tax=Alosa alosa TaxID=278164 RepID=A0AAV6G976_9TELE|nr:hypothetical protein AALO_G00188480 [Alosa alosa]
MRGSGAKKREKIFRQTLREFKYNTAQWQRENSKQRNIYLTKQLAPHRTLYRTPQKSLRLQALQKNTNHFPEPHTCRHCSRLFLPSARKKNGG